MLPIGDPQGSPPGGEPNTTGGHHGTVELPAQESPRSPATATRGPDGRQRRRTSRNATTPDVTRSNRAVRASSHPTPHHRGIRTARPTNTNGPTDPPAHDVGQQPEPQALPPAPVALTPKPSATRLRFDWTPSQPLASTTDASTIASRDVHRSASPPRNPARLSRFDVARRFEVDAPRSLRS